jgi:hypothetical protein
LRNVKLGKHKNEEKPKLRNVKLGKHKNEGNAKVEKHKNRETQK